MRKIFLALPLMLATVALGGDGTLPFGMKGEADALRLSYMLSNFSMVSDGGASAECSPGYHFIPQKGTLSLGSDTFTIDGTCHDGSRKELIGHSGSRNIKLRGNLSGDAPNRQLKGTLSGEGIRAARYELFEN